MAPPLASRAARSRSPLLVAAPVLALALGGLLSGCGGSSEDGDGASGGESATSGTSATTDVDVTVDGDTISPTNKQVEIAVGDTVTLHVTADRAGELHVHSSPEQELEFGKGETDLPLTLDKPGSVDVEEHASETLVLRVLVQ
jgi:plastocyanin